MIAVSDIAARVAYLLIDPSHIRWQMEELVAWINESAGAILTRRPAAFARRNVVSLSEGTLQNIPENGSILIDIVRNIGQDGVTPGKVIRRIDRQAIDDSDLDWHTASKKTAVAQYTYDDRMPRIFYVYPPVVAGTKVELMDSALPSLVSGIEDQFDINAEYMEAVVNYVCYRCNTKDSEFASPALAISFYQAFETALGIKNQTQVAASPNQVGNSV